MGVAGAAVDSQTVLLTGIAGLLAGSLSMALGEWISVKSSQELYENQMEIEMEELNENPEGEKREIILIYQAKGIPKEEATEMAEKIMKDKKQAHQFLVKEELGINAEELKGSAWEAIFILDVCCRCHFTSISLYDLGWQFCTLYKHRS
jgi:VIT1/CCC1 family predicted Fe2+/Mn2+ transporter